MCISIWETFNHYSRTIQMELLNCKILLYFRNNTITFEHTLSIWKVFSYTARFLPFESTISFEGFSFFLYFSMSTMIPLTMNHINKSWQQNENFSQYNWHYWFQQYLCTSRHAFEGLFFPSFIISTGTFLLRFLVFLLTLNYHWYGELTRLSCCKAQEHQKVSPFFPSS